MEEPWFDRSAAIVTYTLTSQFRIGDRVSCQSRNGTGIGIISGIALVSNQSTFYFIDLPDSNIGFGGIASSEITLIEASTNSTNIRISSEYALSQRVEFRDDGTLKQGMIDVICFMENGQIEYIIFVEDEDEAIPTVDPKDIVRAIPD